MKRFRQFIFEDYEFDQANLTAAFHYSFDGQIRFKETLTWNKQPEAEFSSQVLESALQTAHLVLGISYFKAYLVDEIVIKNYELTDEQAEFFNNLYQNGLGEFIFQNNLNFSDVAEFSGQGAIGRQTLENTGDSALVPVSGGKDSLLTSEILRSQKVDFTPLYLTTDGNYPKLIDEFGQPIIVRRIISPQLIEENMAGAYNGHVPFSAIMGSILAVTAVLYGFRDIVLSHESSADEATTNYDGRKINHQYSKSSQFEVLMKDYLKKNISSNLNYFSLIRELGELDIHRIFVERGLFEKYAGMWASCNVANYKQGNDTSNLRWCGNCSKCANAFLLFLPFVSKTDLIVIFNGKNLLEDNDLVDTFKELLGMKDSKPFECVGEINELREAARLAIATGNWPELEIYDTTPKHLPEIQSVKAEIPPQYITALENFVNKA